MRVTMSPLDPPMVPPPGGVRPEGWAGSAGRAAPMLPPGRPWTVLVADENAARARGLAGSVRGVGLRAEVATTLDEMAEALRAPAIRMVIGSPTLGPAAGGGTAPPLFAQIAAARERAYIYLMLVNFWADGRSRAAGLDAGADDYLVLPVARDELRARIDVGLRTIETQDDLALRIHEERAVLDDFRRRSDRVSQDLAEAREVQRAMLPPLSARIGRAEMRLSLLTAGQIGGDLMGYAPRAEGGLALWSLDVSGHGIASALMTGRLAGLLAREDVWGSCAADHDARTGPLVTPRSPAEVLRRLNGHLLRDAGAADGSGGGDVYFTALLAYLDDRTGRLVFAQAGHPHPIVLPAGGGPPRRLGTGGVPVGLMDGARWDVQETRLAPGDRLLVYSDGLTDCIDTWGEMLGDEGVDRILAALPPDDPLEAQVAAVEDALRAHADVNGFDDDISFMMLRCGAAGDG